MAKLEQRRYKNTILNNEQRRHTWKNSKCGGVCLSFMMAIPLQNNGSNSCRIVQCRSLFQMIE
ncbi:MAG: hypothetical protein II651_02750 [Selenomonas sp.]|nr:hypothetical protein [Selenomonas sp.]